MMYPVLKGVGYALIHTPDMLIHNGTTQTTEKIVNPESAYLKTLPAHMRSFEQVLNYAPNQVYIGNMTPEDLRKYEMPWFDQDVEKATRYGKYGEIMPQDEFILLMKIADAFELVMIEKGFMEQVRKKLAEHPLFTKEVSELPEGVEIQEIEEAVKQHAEAIYHEGKLVGCVKKAHDVDINLSAHVLFENLAVKASGILAFKHLIAKNGFQVEDVQYVIECSEEACGDMNQRGGGNFAKSIAERCGAVNATGSDTRGFCAAPVHALTQAAALVQSGIYENVVIVAGGATAKLGMNGKDHVKKGMPVLEDVLGSFAIMVSKNDGVNPVIRTDLTGKHTVGTGSSPQAVISSLVIEPLDRAGLKMTDIDKFAVEMQNPDVTKPAGAGDVPEANYKMIAALGVKRRELERSQLAEFIVKHGMKGWAPTQGHIPSGVPYLGFAKEDLTNGTLNRVMVIGKGSLFLGRMTDLFDGVSIIMERNSGTVEEIAGVSPEEDKNLIAEGRKEAKQIRVGLTLLGSEHGVKNMVEGAELAAKESQDLEIVLIGPKVDTALEIVEADTEAEMYTKMEELIAQKYLQTCVTMHYDFPVGVSTVGKVVTPGYGKEMFLATTTGTASVHRVEAMVKNALHGIITAKAMGIKDPAVGILNLDGARQVERALKQLDANGYRINFTESQRADGGAVMRGNDLLGGTSDVMVTDTLTGNILMKVFSSYTTGGSYEAMGYGYGPGIGENYDRIILILSRASGKPVVANALKYAVKLVQGKLNELAKTEFAKARKANLEDILKAITKDVPKEEISAEVVAPPKEVVTGAISGIDIMDLEDAVKVLWQKGIYAESGMGCTGPIVRVAEEKIESATKILVDESYLA